MKDEDITKNDLKTRTLWEQGKDTSFKHNCTLQKQVLIY